MESPSPRIEALRELGAGTTGRVVHGRLVEPFGDCPAGFEVAVKTLHRGRRASARARRAFAEEARVGLAVRDPSLVRVLCNDEDGPDGPRIVMAYVPGRSLSDVLREDGPLPEPQVRRVGVQLARALAALDEAGYAHGDIKPDNARLDSDGRAVLVDLGFARRVDGRSVQPDAGTLRYLPPERVDGGRAEPAGDVFALGLVLYELATGRHPFDLAGAAGSLRGSSRELVRGGPQSADALLAELARARYVPPSRFEPQLSPFFDRLLADLLRREPAGRPTARVVAERLDAGEASAWWREHKDLRGGARGASERAEAHLTPLVGRDRELEALGAALAAATHPASDAPRARPRGGVLWLQGEAGSGKSRLVSHGVARARHDVADLLHLYARCSSSDDARGPFQTLLNRWLRLPTDAAPGEREREALEHLVPPREATTLLQLLDPTFLGTLEGAASEALARWLLAVAEGQPLLVFVDDLERAGAETLAALERVLDGLAGRPLLLVLGVTGDVDPDEPRAWARLRARLAALAASPSPKAPHYDELRLEPLDEEAVLELVTSLFHHAEPRLRIARELWKRCQGNAGLLAELLRDLLARGIAAPVTPAHAVEALEPIEPKLRLTVEPHELPLPKSLGTSIAERYLRVEPATRAWLERAAVFGGRVDADLLVRAYAPAERHEVDAALSRLVHLGWLAPTGAHYRFARPALREAVYRSLSESRRVRMHAAAARALAPAPGAPLRVADAYQRAFHLRAAGHPSSLLGVLRPLLRALVVRGQVQRAHTVAVWGLEALDRLAPTPSRGRLRVELLEAAADAADRLGLRDQERYLLDRLAELELDPESQPELACRVYLLHGRYATGVGQHGLARGFLRNAVQLAEKAVDPMLASEAGRRLALVQAQAGELVEARELSRAAARRTDDPRQVALAWLATSQLDILEDRLDRALRTIDRALRLMRRKISPPPLGMIAYAQMLRARSWRSAGVPARALAAASRGLQLAIQAGERRLEAELGARLGGMLLDLDRREDAEARLRDALATARSIEDPRAEVLAELGLGILLWEADDQEAAPTLERAARRADETGFRRAEALALAIWARVALLAGDLEAARGRSERAMALLEHHGSELNERIVITATRARVLVDADEEAAGRALLADLRRRMHRHNRRMEGQALRLAQRRYVARLLAASWSTEGVVFPRRTRGEAPT